MRAPGYLLALVVIILTLLAGGGLWLVRSEAGSTWLLQAAAGRVPGELRLEGMAGDLVSGVRATRVSYRSPLLELEIDGLELEMDWPAVMAGQFAIRRLASTRVGLHIEAGEPSPSGLHLDPVRLPLPIAVETARIDELVLQGAGFDETLAGLELVGQWSTAGEIMLAALHFELREVAVDAVGRILLAGRLPMRATLGWRSVAGQLAGRAEVQGDLDRLEVEHELTVPVAVSTRGSWVAVDTAPRISARSTWPELEFSLAGRPVRSTDGVLQTDGWFDAYELSLASDMEVAGRVELETVLEAKGDLDELRIDGLTLHGLGGDITSTGRVVFKGPELALQFRGQGLNPGYLDPAWPGELDVLAAIETRGADAITVDIDRVNGTLRDWPVDGNGRFSRQGNELAVTGGQLRAGPNRLVLDGRLQPELDARFQIDAPDLAGLWPELKGRAAGAGRIAGTWATPVVDLDLNATDLVYRQQSADGLQLRARVDAKGSLAGTLTVAGLRSDATAIGKLQVDASGRLEEHRLGVTLTEGLVDVRLATTGSWDGLALDERVDDGVVAVTGVAPWKLRETAALRFENGGLAIGAQCWDSAPSASLCIEPTRLGGADARIGARLLEFPLQTFNAWLGGGLELLGTVDAEVDLGAAADGIRGAVKWQQAGTRVVYRGAGDTVLETGFEDVHFNASLDSGQVRIDGSIRGDYELAIDVAGTLFEPLDPDGALDVSLRGRVPDLAAPLPLVNRLVNVADLGGSLLFDLRATGTRRSPSVDGTVNLLGGHALLPDAGIELREISAAAVGRNNAPVLIAVGARSGGGFAQVYGELDWSEVSGAFAELVISGRDFEAIRFPGQSVELSPELRARVDERRIALTGELGMPRASITVQSLPENAVSPSPDTVVHISNAGDPVKRAKLFEVTGLVNLVLGDAVRFSGFGLETRLDGELQLKRAPGALTTTATGALRLVDGRFAAYGKELAIERGTLVFAGPIDQPSIDVRAIRRLEYDDQPVRVGVLLSGTPANIQSRLYSDPAMSEADTLSFLVIDRPLSQAESGDTDKLSGAALSLGLKQALPITRRLGETLGLDELGFEGGAAEDASVITGKRLGEDLQLRYKYGLFNRIGTFIVRYRIGGGLSLEAGSGEEQTLDLIHAIEW